MLAIKTLPEMLMSATVKQMVTHLYFSTYEMVEFVVLNPVATSVMALCFCILISSSKGIYVQPKTK